MSRALAALCLVVLTGRPTPSLAFVQYDAFVGWGLRGALPLELHDQKSVPPAKFDNLGDFSLAGARCPPLSTPDYLCAHVLSKADLVNGLFSVHTVAKTIRRNASGGNNSHVYAYATIRAVGFTGVVVPEHGFAIFDLKLHGTLVSTASTSAVTVETMPVATLQAGRVYAVQCFGDNCPPISAQAGGEGRGQGAGSDNGVLR